MQFLHPHCHFALATNPGSTKNSQYAYAEAVKWFRERERTGKLTISESVETWRCHPKIAAFSDTIFDASWAFPSTVSRNEVMTNHDGVFLLMKQHVGNYVERFAPQCLRSMAGSGKEFDLDFMNSKVAKGTTYDRVLIVPTAGISDFLRKGSSLEPVPAASFYVAVTRAAQSVAIVIDNPGASTLPYWTP